MKKYDYVEDYLEVIAGLRDPVTMNPPQGLGWFSPIINLARYDISVMQNMSETTIMGGALTEKQGELAIRIIGKYQRQLAALNIDSRLGNLTKFRKPFRSIDHSKKLDVIDNEITLHFHYDKNMIDEVREFAKDSQGHCHWDRANRVWKLSLTEYNINWAVTWAEVNGFEISPVARRYYDLVREQESQTYAICLQQSSSGLEITNATDSMMTYLKENIGELSETNIVKFVDVSATTGYTVDQSILNEFEKKFGNELTKLMLHRESMYDYNDVSSVAALIRDYAAITRRYPIVVYEPDLSNRLLEAIKKVFDEADIEIIGNSKKNKPFSPDVKVVHTIKPVTEHRIPLLVTAAGIITGGERHMMLQNSEKVVFVTPGVYNSKKKSQVPHL